MTITANTFLSVNIGAAPNDGTGDPLRTAFTKLNANFDQITNYIWPNLQISRLSSDIDSSTTSSFNFLGADTVNALILGNANTSIVGNTLTVNNFVLSNLVSNVITANSFVGTLGDTQANPAFITNLSVTNNVTVNNTIQTSNLTVNDIGSFSNLTVNNVGSFSNISVTGNITLGSSSIVGNTFWLLRSFGGSTSSIVSNVNLLLTPSTTSAQYRFRTLGNATVFQTNVVYSTIQPGAERIYVFRNNADSLSERYVILPTAFNNLNVTNVRITSTGSAFMHFIPFDDTVANVYVMIANC